MLKTQQCLKDTCWFTGLSSHKLWPHHLPGQNNTKLEHFKFPNCLCLLWCLCMHCIVLWRALVIYPPHVCASLSWGSPHRACHPIRTKSDFTKRLHHLGGLLGSRHWDALQLVDCLHSFAQQLAHSASALKQIPYCLMLTRSSWRIETDRSKVRTSCTSHNTWGAG